MSHDVTIAFISGSGVIIASIVAFLTAVYQGRKTRSEIQPGNGHTLGESIAHIEEVLWRHEQRLDSIEVELRETKAGVEEAKGAIRAHIIDVNGSGK